ncbi:MAG TPA: peptidase S9, partial [Chloroflexota bacterium]|nr:peptidase S9 [Chloroflexota bacterium]
AAAPGTAHAQYFGQHQVQYRTFDFRILRTPHFDVYFYPEEEEAVRDAARMAERWYARLSRILDYEFESRQPLILYAAHPHFQQTTALGGGVGEGTGGVTEAFKQRVILPFAASYEETDHVLGHELVHAFQYDISGLGRAGGGLEEAAQRFNVPLWFIEGMAEYLSVGPVDPHTAMWLRDAALTGRLPTIEQLNYDPSFFPYRWGQALWAYIGGRWGDATIGQILKQVGQGVPFEDAFQRILNADLEEIVRDWQESIRRTYLPLIADRREAREEARPLITRRERGGRYNVSPALSPDGRRVVFLSELNFLDIELFVADAQTGQVQRRLVRGTSFDPHFGSLRFINSAGTWSPDGTRFAFSALRKAQDVVVVLDVDRARIVREYEVDGVDEITNPTWSPDGSTLVFSGMSGGVSDLWALELASGRSRRLTDDAFADMQPAFSPDGRTLAFVTDRGPDTNLEQLRYGNYQIATMAWPGGEITGLRGFERGKNINPQWASDGTSFYFVSDREGIANVYRYYLADGRTTQVTDLFTGVSGITDLSPAISSATRADRLVFTAYERGVYNMYALTDPAELAGTTPRAPQLAQSGDPLPAVLPPSPRPTEPAYNRVLALLRNPEFGRPEPAAEQTYGVAPYRARLSLDYLGQPTVGVAGATGPYARGGVYGGVGAIFSDMLGRHTVYGVVQAQGQIDEIGFNVVYLNRQNR